MSRYDIKIAHDGRAEEALQTTRGLVSNYLASFTEQLTHCDELMQQITLFDASLSPEDMLSPQ